MDGAPVVFADITRAAGLDKFRHKSGSSGKTTILETPGSGVALLDYDNDGWLDIYLVNGSTVAALKGKETPPRAMLLHNNHDGTFTDVTEKAGVANERWGFGVAVCDYDNDGWPDIYISNFGKNRLYHNNHDGGFTDVAEKAGVTVGCWSTGATWGDYDRDGLLDLFVPGYVKFDIDNPPISGKGGLPPGYCQFRGIEVMCGPRGLPGESDHLFHNNGDGTFTDVSGQEVERPDRPLLAKGPGRSRRLRLPDVGDRSAMDKSCSRLRSPSIHIAKRDPSTTISCGPCLKLPVPNAVATDFAPSSHKSLASWQLPKLPPRARKK